MKLWVDDIRKPPVGWIWATTSVGAIYLLSHEKIDALSLDHDLGEQDTTRPVVLYMCEHNIWPKEIYVHSANPVGVEWLKGMIERYRT